MNTDTVHNIAWNIILSLITQRRTEDIHAVVEIISEQYAREVDAELVEFSAKALYHTSHTEHEHTNLSWYKNYAWMLLLETRFDANEVLYRALPDLDSDTGDQFVRALTRARSMHA